MIYVHQSGLQVLFDFDVCFGVTIVIVGENIYTGPRVT
jgi:hypothetical protein